MLVGDDGAWPSDQRTADVTNVVKPTQFESPHEDLCYKRRQSKPKNHHYQRKSRWIDDVCNNTHQATRQRHSAAGAEGTEGTCRGAGGRRRGLAGLRDDAPSQRLAARTASGRAAAHRHTQRPGPPTPGTPVGPQATPHVRPRHTQRKRAAAHRAAARSRN